MTEFVLQWKQFGFRIALNNWLIGFTKEFIGAKKMTITYFKYPNHNYRDIR